MLNINCQFIWPSDFRGEHLNVKSQQTTDAKWWQKLTLPELNITTGPFKRSVF